MDNTYYCLGINCYFTKSRTMLRCRFNAHLNSILACAFFLYGSLLFSQSVENKYSWWTWSVGANYYNENFNNLRSSNPYLLNSPSNNIFLPTVHYYAGNIDKLFSEIYFGGIWRNQKGAYENYSSI